MDHPVRGFLSLLGRILSAMIFLASAAMNHIPNFSAIVAQLEGKQIPMPTAAHVVAIVLMLVGGVSLVLGWYARIGAALLLVFLALAGFYFHDFWNLAGAEAQNQQIHFMKNVAMMGAMLIVMANGPGAWSLDNRATTPAPEDQAVG